MSKKLEIIKYPNPILQKKSGKIKDPLDPEVQKLIENMIYTLASSSDGVGLSAPQVGKSVRLCIIREGSEILSFLNPQISQYSQKRVEEKEGCLSFPGVYLPISRAENIKVRYLNEKGEKSKLKATGLLARILQHEIDHLDGILIVDRSKK